MTFVITISAAGWQIPEIAGIIFDKDGTLIDSHKYWGRIIGRRARALIECYKLEESDYPILCHTLGFSLETQKLRPEGPIGLVSRDEVIKIMNDYLLSRDVDSTVEQIAQLFVEEHEKFAGEIFNYIELLPGVTELLARLHEKEVKCAIVTSDTPENAERIMKHLGIDNYFSVMLGKGSTKETKKTGAPALMAVELMGLPKENVITVGDAPMDIIMAKNGGLRGGIGVTTGQTVRDVFLNHTPHVVDSLEELQIS